MLALPTYVSYAKSKMFTCFQHLKELLNNNNEVFTWDPNDPTRNQTPNVQSIQKRETEKTILWNRRKISGNRGSRKSFLSNFSDVSLFRGKGRRSSVPRETRLEGLTAKTNLITHPPYTSKCTPRCSSQNKSRQTRRFDVSLNKNSDVLDMDYAIKMHDPSNCRHLTHFNVQTPNSIRKPKFKAVDLNLWSYQTHIWYFMSLEEQCTSSEKWFHKVNSQNLFNLMYYVRFIYNKTLISCRIYFYRNLF